MPLTITDCPRWSVVGTAQCLTLVTAPEKNENEKQQIDSKEEELDYLAISGL